MPESWPMESMRHRPAERVPSPRPAGFRRERLGPWRELLVLADGRNVLVRPIDPRDAEALRAFFSTLTPEEVRFRFMHPMKEMSPQLAHDLTVLDPRNAFALVVAEYAPPGEARIGAVVRAGVDADGRRAEFALTVNREFAGQGLGTYLMRRIVDWCRRRRLDAIYGEVLVDNHAMLHIADKLGFERSHLHGEGGVTHVTRRLRREAASHH